VSSKQSRKETRHAETWSEFEDIVFAISSHKLANEFATAFGHKVEDGPRGSAGDDDEDEDSSEDSVARELQEKIAEMEKQLGEVWNADLKARMVAILGGLKAQLQAREGAAESEDD